MGLFGKPKNSDEATSADIAKGLRALDAGAKKLGRMYGPSHEKSALAGQAGDRAALRAWKARSDAAGGAPVPYDEAEYRTAARRAR